MPGGEEDSDLRRPRLLLLHHDLGTSIPARQGPAVFRGGVFAADRLPRPPVPDREPLRGPGEAPAPGGERGAGRIRPAIQHQYADRRPDVDGFRPPAIPRLSRGQLGGDRIRHSVSDRRQLGLRQTHSRALAAAPGPAALCLQARRPGLRCHAALCLRR